MPHINSGKLFILAFAGALILLGAGIGFTVGQLTRTPPPATPTPIPALTPEPKVGISDYASLFAKIDKNQFPIEQYHMLLTEFPDCMPHLVGDFAPGVAGVPLSETESAALQHFMVSGTLMLGIGFQNPYQTPPNYSLYQTLTVLMQNCPNANVTSEIYDQEQRGLRLKIPGKPQDDSNFRYEICKRHPRSEICDPAPKPPP